MIGEHTVSVTPIGGAAVDISCLIETLNIHHGRDDTASQPDASSATLDLSLDAVTEALPAALEVGSGLTVRTTLGGIGYVRFTGRVTDIDIGWNDAGPDTPDRPIAQVLATGPLAELGRRIVGDAPYGQQLDGARVAAVMTTAGLPLDPAFSDPGTVQILPRDIDSQPALDVAAEAAESAGGVIWETRAGAVRYADADHRRNMASALVLDACDVLVSPGWRRTTEGLINRVSIGYGVAPEGSDQPRYVAERPDSIAAFGRYEFTTTTALAAAADAAAMGQLLLTRNRVPVWVMDALPVDVAGLDAAQTAALLGLDMHDLITLTGLPAIGSAPTSAVLWVEGWEETLARGSHATTLTVSGYCRTVPPPRWDDMPPALTWDGTPGTWDDATCLGPQPSQGRWADVPATLRWNQVDPAITWDTWNG